MPNDFVTALRTLRRHPGFTSLAVTTLGLGIGASATVFSAAESVFLRPLPYPAPDELVALFHGTVEGVPLAASRLEVPLLREQTDVFQGVGARSSVVDVTFEAGGAPPTHASALRVSYNYLSILGVEPYLGRTFLLEDAIPSPGSEQTEEDGPQGPALVITYGLWQRAFGGDPDFSEHTFRIAGTPFRVIGVLPRAFRLLHAPRDRWVRGTQVDLFVVWPEEYFTYPGDRYRSVFPLARLRPGVSARQADAAMEGMSAQLRAEVPQYEREGLRFRAHPLREYLTAGSRQILLVLGGGVLFLLLLISANLANLMLVRGRSRSGEDAVRAAVGCGTGHLFWERFQECALLVLGGGVIGLALAAIAMRSLEALVPRTVPLFDQLGISGRILLGVLGIAFVLLLFFASVSGLQVGRLDLVGILKSEAAGRGGPGRRRLMNALVVSELALSMVLLVGAAAMVRTLIDMTRADLGYDADRVLAFDLMVYAEDFRSVEAREMLYAELEDRLASIPGVEAVARTMVLPLSGIQSSAVYGWDDDSWERGTERADINVCTGDYFEALGTRLLAGRFFNQVEATDSTESIIIDEKLARTAWPDGSAIGKRLRWRLRGEGVVVGVVEHMLTKDFGVESQEVVYIPEASVWPGRAGTFVVRSGVGPESLTASVRRVLQTVHPTLVPYNIHLLSDRVALSMAPTRFVLFLLCSFAAVALLVALTGLFGVMSYAVRTRTAELGIRMALGADRARILVDVLRQGILLTAIGSAAGIVGALWLGRVVESVVFGVSPGDPLVLVGTAFALAAVSLAACLAPARWACRVDPVSALRTG